MINPGELRHRITIEQKTITKDELLNNVEEWAEYYSCYASINGLSGSEYWAAQAQQAENTVTFLVRYHRKIENMNPQAFRIIFKGSVYDIKHIDNFKYMNDTVKFKAVQKLG